VIVGAVLHRPSYGMRFAIEPKPNEPLGDLLLSSIRQALPS
jgi:hypothetical protein